MDFLGHELRTRLAVSRGAPRLGAGYVSSVPGLYFTGLPAAASYGPVMRFVCGRSSRPAAGEASGGGARLTGARGRDTVTSADPGGSRDPDRMRHKGPLR